MVFLVLSAPVSLVAQQQGSDLPDAPQPSSPPPAANTQQQNPPAAPADDQQDSDQKPGAMKRAKRHLHDQMSSGCINAVIKQGCWGKDKEGQQDGAGGDQGGSNQGQAQKQTQPPLPEGQKVPRSSPQNGPNESSSKDGEGDLGPIPDRYSSPGADDVKEMQKWDPHRAAKDIEVGDYYYKEKNYHAAESRYREALEWKPNDALATFRLAQALEKLGKNEEARKNYQTYLKILPSGELAPKAKEALKRLPAPPVNSSELNQPSSTSPLAGTPR
ncbi:MAG TPA: tetratricopeptide repeat protein [Terriglobales bacterium]|nr:tetratricopeptide repeat protein [Terriglobales bacterium]